MELDPLVYGTTTRPFAQLSSVPTPKPSSDNEEVPPNAPPPTPVPHVVSLSPLAPNALKRAPVYATSSYRGAGLAELSLKEQNDIKEHSDILSNVQKIRSEHKMSAKSRKRTYASTETTENIDALCANAAAKAIPCICLCKPHELAQHTVSTWNRFCGTQESEAISLLHSFDSLSANDFAIIVNRKGRFLTLDRNWLEFFAYNSDLQILPTLARMTDDNLLKTIVELPRGARVLVYDFANVRCLEEMLRWPTTDGHFVMPIGDTGFPGPCVVDREDNMLVIHNI